MILYDIITGKEYTIPNTGRIKFSESIGIHYTSLSHLISGKLLQVKDRYLLTTLKSRIFTLVDVGNNQKFECITNKSIFIHLEIPYNENEAKYVYELRKGRQKFASIGGRLFSINYNIYDVRGAVRVVPTKLLQNKLESKLNIEMKRSLYSRLKRAIDSDGGYKSKRTLELIGCDFYFLKKYISSKFTKGMSWENRNLWHIDHIKPCSEFDLTDPDEQSRCFHYTNLQPLWASTKIANQMGEENYVGNLDKNKTGKQFEFWAKPILVERFKEKYTPEQIEDLLSKLFSKGFRRVYFF